MNPQRESRRWHLLPLRPTGFAPRDATAPPNQRRSTTHTNRRELGPLQAAAPGPAQAAALNPTRAASYVRLAAVRDRGVTTLRHQPARARNPSPHPRNLRTPDEPTRRRARPPTRPGRGTPPTRRATNPHVPMKRAAVHAVSILSVAMHNFRERASG
jgi:hypothetical protein